MRDSLSSSCSDEQSAMCFCPLDVLLRLSRAAQRSNCVLPTTLARSSTSRAGLLLQLLCRSRSGLLWPPFPPRERAARDGGGGEVGGTTRTARPQAEEAAAAASDICS